MGAWKEFSKGLWSENPIFRIVLGMCPTLAVTTSASNGIGMGLATTFVLVASNVVISAVRHLIPKKIRIPAFIVTIATFVTIVDLAMNGYFHALHKSLGLFIPLIVVNCIILGRAEAFASKNSVVLSFFDGLGMGLGFTLSLGILGSIRELFGNGSIFGVVIFGKSYLPLLLMILPPGAFIVLGILLGLMNQFELKMAARQGRLPIIKREHNCATCVLHKNWFVSSGD
ncbi:MAG: electron transport complex subunit RsxE [Candidatus Latescibacteria bacterium 4484_7]|nr:MAG: electron transport complex subunit RsxE [Candidatus Latescibacteria bacterium 4484_7]